MTHLDRSSHPSARVAIVLWAAQMGAVTAEALATRERISVASSRARLLAATRAGLLVRERPLADQPALFSATAAGIRLAGARALQPAHVTAANARHTTLCVQAAAALEQIYPSHTVMGERELRREEHAAGAALASASLGHSPDRGRALHRPDLLIWPDTVGALPVAVEVELTVKAPQRLLAICRAWARCECVDGVLYLAASGVRRALQRAITAAQAEGKIALLMGEALGFDWD
jgi:hypothetical protein